MSTGPAVSANVLDVAAFGDRPDTWPLPPATGRREAWLRAVAAGGQGRYACALTELHRLMRHPDRVPVADPYASLAASTRASFLRQLGWHDRARVWDGRAAALATTAEAEADALLGLAADALGVGRFAASARALELAAVAAGDTPRSAVRLAWVSAELAMFRGDGVESVGHAERGVRLAEDLPSVRHAVKSQVVLAAALCSRGDLQQARREGADALNRARRHGLLPLQWAVASLLSDIGADDCSPVQIRELRDAAAQTVTRWGGVWRPR